MPTEPRFDHWIREAMQAREVPYQPEHWDVFASKLADAPTSDDDALREKLSHVEVPLPVGHWSAFSELLDDAMPADSLDDMVRTQLTDLEIPVAAAATWAAMSARLDDAMPTQDAQFDEDLRNRMQRFETPYNVAHWAKMAEKLDRQRRWYNVLLQYKVAEVALMLLLLFTVVNLTVITPAIKERNAAKNKFYTPDMTPPVQRVSPYLPAATMPSSPSNYIKTKLITPKVAAPMASNMSPKEAEKVPALAAVSLLPPTPNAVSGSYGEMDMAVVTDNIASDKIPYQAMSPIAPIPTTDLVAYIAPIASESELGADKTVVENIAAVTLASPVADKEVLSSVMDVQAIVVNTVQQPRFTLSIVAGGDIDNVHTPFDSQRRNKPYTVRGTGFTTGLTVACNSKNTSIETGLTYSEKSYTTPLTFNFGNFHDGYFRERLEKIRYRIFSVPVNVRLVAATWGQHKVYVLGGTTFNAVADAVYTRTLSLLSNSRENEDLPLPSYIPPSPSADMHFANGIAKGGTLGDNGYITANIGIGYEYAPKPGLRIFVQPSFHRNLTERGLGPKHDQINSMSVLVGTRMSL